MKVELIDYTGKYAPEGADVYAGMLLLRAKATRLSREERDKFLDGLEYRRMREELKYVANTIRSSWEFVDYTFEVSGVTRAFAQQFTRTRNGSYAMQTQRVVSMAGNPVTKPEAIAKNHLASLQWENAMEAIAFAYESMLVAGIQPQDARGLLPMNSHTSIIAKFNLRTMADLCGKRENLRAQGEYQDVFAMMKEKLLRVHPWASDFLTPERTSTPHLDELMKDVLGEKSPFEIPGFTDALKEIDKLKATWG